MPDAAGKPTRVSVASIWQNVFPVTHLCAAPPVLGVEACLCTHQTPQTANRWLERMMQADYSKRQAVPVMAESSVLCHILHDKIQPCSARCRQNEGSSQQTVLRTSYSAKFQLLVGNSHQAMQAGSASRQLYRAVQLNDLAHHLYLMLTPLQLQP